MAKREQMVVGELQIAGVSDKGTVIQELRKYTATVDPAACVTAVPTVTTVTLTGVKVGDIVIAVIPPSADAATAFVCSARVSAADTVKLFTFGTNAVDPASGTYTFIVGRFA